MAGKKPTLSDMVKQQKAAYDTIRQSVKTNRKLFNAVLKQVSKVIDLDPEVDYAGRLNISVAGDRDTLGEVFGILRRLGLQPETRPTAEKSQYFSTFWVDVTNTRVVWLYFSSTVCRRVQVGMQMVEQPIYEVTCE